MPSDNAHARTGADQGDLDRQVASLEATLKAKLALLATIRSLDARWSGAVRKGHIEYFRSTAKQLQRFYEGWMKGSDAILERMARLEALGREIRRSEDFRDAVGFCPAGIEVDQTASAFRRLERGEGIPLAEAGHAKVRRRRAS